MQKRKGDGTSLPEKKTLQVIGGNAILDNFIEIRYSIRWTE